MKKEEVSILFKKKTFIYPNPKNDIYFFLRDYSIDNFFFSIYL